MFLKFSMNENNIHLKRSCKNGLARKRNDNTIAYFDAFG